METGWSVTSQPASGSSCMRHVSLKSYREKCDKLRFAFPHLTETDVTSPINYFNLHLYVCCVITSVQPGEPVQAPKRLKSYIPSWRLQQLHPEVVKHFSLLFTCLYGGHRCVSWQLYRHADAGYEEIQNRVFESAPNSMHLCSLFDNFPCEKEFPEKC